MATAPSSAEHARQLRLAACTQALAQRSDLPGLAQAGSCRGLADALACHARFDLPLAGRALRPPGLAGTLFDALAQARAELLGAQWLPGLARNLEAPRGAALSLQGLWRAWAFALFRGRAAPCPAGFAQALRALQPHVAAPAVFAQAAAALALRWAEPLRQAALDTQLGVTPAANPSQADPAGQEEADPELPPVEAEQDPAQPMALDSASGAPLPPMVAALAQDYRIFSRLHDRVVTPDQLASPTELIALRARLDAELAPYRQDLTRLAHQLQRVLLARQRQHWEADQEAGLLDASRLSRLVADPAQTRVFRLESEGRFQHAAVTLLLDNSGSLRGRPILTAALTADILARTLERCAIPVEVLGFTTADGEGGAPRREWEQAGRPAHPGRLNALRHIVYKPMATPWRRARLGLGAMLKEGLLKENIDGEALAWASQRLLQRSESRRLLIVVSDGVPMDRSTLSANPGLSLDQHLHQVVAWIEGQTDLELCAIGIGHSVARHYRRSLHLAGVEALGPALCKGLAEWLV